MEHATLLRANPPMVRARGYSCSCVLRVSVDLVHFVAMRGLTCASRTLAKPMGIGWPRIEHGQASRVTAVV
jgi:hypothetical protein